jgi:hypothetical protein
VRRLGVDAVAEGEARAAEGSEEEEVDTSSGCVYEEGCSGTSGKEADEDEMCRGPEVEERLDRETGNMVRNSWEEVDSG